MRIPDDPEKTSENPWFPKQAESELVASWNIRPSYAGLIDSQCEISCRNGA